MAIVIISATCGAFILYDYMDPYMCCLYKLGGEHERDGMTVP